MKPGDLTVAPVGVAAAKYAVERWHYSHTLPPSPVRFGVWEHGQFVGVVLFGRGATPYLFDPYHLTQYAGCELVRIALTTHEAPVTQIVAAAIRQLHAASPGLRLIVSFADPAHGHHGGIYQAGGWLYLGMTAPADFFENPHTGEVVHPRTVAAAERRRRTTGTTSLARVQYRRVHLPGKHRYVMPLDKAMRRMLTKHALPYPERIAVEGSTVIRPTPVGKYRFDSCRPLAGGQP